MAHGFGSELLGLRSSPEHCGRSMLGGLLFTGRPGRRGVCVCVACEHTLDFVHVLSHLATKAFMVLPTRTTMALLSHVTAPHTILSGNNPSCSTKSAISSPKHPYAYDIDKTSQLKFHSFRKLRNLPRNKGGRLNHRKLMYIVPMRCPVPT